jgi:hypothetical protein
VPPQAPDLHGSAEKAGYRGFPPLPTLAAFDGRSGALASCFQ